MKLSTAWPLAVVLTKSQLRSRQRSKLLAKVFGNPYVILIVDVLLLGILGTIGYYVTLDLPQELMSTAGRLLVEALVGIPTATSFMMILLGILSELSQPIQSTSADLVNWLPIAPGEYVLGSTLSLSYTYSFLLAGFLGLTLGPAISLGYGAILVASALMGLLSLFLGASVVELIRAVTNRISSSFYRKSGRSGIFMRLGLTIIMLVILQLVLSGRIIVSLLGRLNQTVAADWYVPVMWPSLTVQSFNSAANLTPVGYGALSLAFMLIVFGLAIGMRKAYWVPVPIAIRLSSQPYHASFNTFQIPGLDVAESAIIRKDLHSLTRRREMARFLAIPFVLAVSIWASAFPYAGSSQGFSLTDVLSLYLYLVPIAMFCWLLSMTSIGQEGSAIWNLYVAPLDAGKLVNAKIYLTTMLGSVLACGLLLAVALLLKPGVIEILSLLLLGLLFVVEFSALGLYVAGRFPDFRETIRSPYVSLSGSLLGMILGLIVGGGTILPIFLPHEYVQIQFPPLVLSILIGLLFFVAFWRLAIRQIRSLLSEIQV